MQHTTLRARESPVYRQLHGHAHFPACPQVRSIGDELPGEQAKHRKASEGVKKLKSGKTRTWKSLIIMRGISRFLAFANFFTASQASRVYDVRLRTEA